MNSAGIYIHIPFCVKKCPYCDFYSVPFSGELKSRYLAAVIRDISAVAGRPLADTVYFGGGTPSLLSSEDFKALLDALSQSFLLSPDTEITAELNPGDASPEYLKSIRQSGVNRLSVGVQSLDNSYLSLLGRRHTAEAAAATIAAARAAGFANISADIMIALPGQTAEMAAGDARKIVSLGVEHISAYILSTEHSGRFWSQPLSLPTDDAAADIYGAVCRELAGSGFEHYEISNFAARGQYGRHNLKYWLCDDYYAFGAAAAGCLNGRRYRFSKDISGYISGLAPEDDGAVTAEDYIICTLRTSFGLDSSVLRSRYDFTFPPPAKRLIEQYISAGYMARRGSVLTLTEKGFLVSNNILAHLI